MADKTEKYFKAWAGDSSCFEMNKELLERLGFKSQSDLRLHMYNMFLFTMFCKCIDDPYYALPKVDSVSGQNTKPESVGASVNDPSKWLEYYHNGGDDMVCPIAIDNGDYIVMHSGLYDRSDNHNDVYNLFKVTKNSRAPYTLAAVSTTNDCMWVNWSYIKDRGDARAICCGIKDKCKRIAPFGNIDDVIFNCEKLGDWKFNPNMNRKHVLKDHLERKKGYSENEIVQMCTNACQKSISNYRYAYPYLFYEDGPSGSKIRRGFLLPLEDKDKNKVVFVATVMKIIRQGKGSSSYHYSIEDILTNDMAIEQARRVSSVEVDWMSKILEKKIK